MARSTKTQKALNLNAAHGLLSRGSSVAEAATILAQERGISLRQAYRYLHDARAFGRAMPVGEPSVPATFKIPRDVLAQLRAYSRRSGVPLSVIVTEAIEKRLIGICFRSPAPHQVTTSLRAAGCELRSSRRAGLRGEERRRP
jgi:hypothetical protein